VLKIVGFSIFALEIPNCLLTASAKDQATANSIWRSTFMPNTGSRSGGQQSVNLLESVSLERCLREVGGRIEVTIDYYSRTSI
jgi:hypothetical protein